LQYRFFNRAGFIVLSSNRAEVGQRDVNTYFSELVLNGETFVRLQENENEFIGLEPDRHGGSDTSVSGTTLPIDLDLRPGSVIAQAYTPVMQDGRFNGAIEVHINVTQTALLVRTVMTVGRWVLVGIVLLVAAATFFVIRRNIRDRNRELAEVREARETASRAEDEVRLLNAELEQRVADRTADLGRAQEQLLRQERLAALGQLTATVSHELRNPLGAVRNTLFAVGARIKDKGLGVEGSLERAERAILRCNNIISEMLDYVREKKLEPVSTNADRWLGQLLAELPVPEPVRLSTKLDTAGLQVEFDNERLRRAVTNVFDNACQAMVGEGDAPPATEGLVVTVATRRGADRLEISIADTGPGISEELQGRIFEPLYSTKSFGVGLGLPLVQQIMTRHGGGVEVRSEVGRGTEMILWLPLEPAVDQDTTEQAA
ncbi:MAG: hypothetical protein HKM95_17765, partial [Inquilinus sp.]|nr:hypothetical protein [Inquilinus sp.]